MAERKSSPSRFNFLDRLHSVNILSLMTELNRKDLAIPMNGNRSALEPIRDELLSLHSICATIECMKPAGNYQANDWSIFVNGFGAGRLLGRLEVLTRTSANTAVRSIAGDVDMLSMAFAQANGQDNFRQLLEGLRRANKMIPSIVEKIDAFWGDNRSLASVSLPAIDGNIEERL